MATQQKVRKSGHSGVLTAVFGMALAAVLASGLFIGLRQAPSSSGQALAPAVEVRVPDAVTSAELRALKEARAEAQDVVVAALPDPVTSAELRALKEAQADQR